MNFYSQRGEDQWLYENGHIQDTGFYIDIGSADAYVNSNTAFLDALGWTGICIDPNPEYKDSYKQRATTLEPVAITTYNGTVNFNFSSELGKIDPDSKSGAVACSTLAAFIEKRLINKIDLLSIDTEGHEFDIFTSYYQSYYLPKPQIIIAEYLTLGKEDNRLRDWLAAYTDYQLVHTTDFNYIFIKG